MSDAANVASISALADFRAALATFTDQAKEALIILQLDIRRTLDFLDDQVKIWKADIIAAENAVFEAKNNLARKRMMRIGDHPQDTTEEEKLLKRAQAWLEFSEEKLANTRRWIRNLPDYIKEYEGPARNFQSILEIELPQIMNFLTARIDALEAYERLAPPSGR